MSHNNYFEHVCSENILRVKFSRMVVDSWNSWKFSSSKKPAMRYYIPMIKSNACLHSHDYIIFAVLMHFVALLIFQVVAALKQQKERPSISVPFRTFWPRGIMIFANICSGEQGNSLINMIATRCLLLFTTELILSAIFNSNSNTHKLIKILWNLQSLKFNSLNFNFCLSCKNFCFENNPLYGIS